MSDLTANWVPLTVLLASLAGSAHCAGMCGGLVLASARTRGSLMAYHLGRLAGYLLLGAIAGSLGSALALFSPILSWVATFLMALMFIIAGIKVWRGRALHLTLLPPPLLSRLYGSARGRPLQLGLLSALLPCGWLHTFVLAAATTKSTSSGMGLLLIFWIGTLPALGMAPFLLRQILGPTLRRAPRIAATLLISAGVMSLGLKMKPVVNERLRPAAEAPAACH